MPPKYKKVCPYCGETCEAYYPNNLICKCGAKYYVKKGTWLERKKKKENPDVVEVVRCKDCKYWGTRNSKEIQGICLCGEKDFYYGSEFYPFADDYCSYGERREEDER